MMHWSSKLHMVLELKPDQKKPLNSKVYVSEPKIMSFLGSKEGVK